MIARLILLASRAAATTAWLRTALSSETPCEPRRCGTNDRHVVTRLTPAQVKEWTARQQITCRMSGCPGIMHDPAAREILERLAQWLLAGRVPECCLPDILEHINPALPEADAMAAFEELAEAVVIRDKVADGTLGWVDVLPDATGVQRDEQAADAVQARVDDALTVLVGRSA